MRRTVAKFLIALFVMTVINTVVWQYVAANLYDCVDESVPGYSIVVSVTFARVRWSPGNRTMQPTAGRSDA
jgi:hypothetical protein